ncbi:MAG: hypothetical protein ACI4J5_04575 [Oscillospiraceae bacterium]
MDIQLKLAVPGDEKLIHEMKYRSFLPLYERYHDDETSPVNEKIGKVSAQLKSSSTDYCLL